MTNLESCAIIKLGKNSHLVNWDLWGSFSSLRAIVLPHFFKSGRSTRSGARRAGEYAISFLQSFFLWGYTYKEKSVKRVAVAIISGTIYRCQDFLAAFLWKKRPKEKLSKERAVFALKPRGSATRRAVAFEKATQNNRAKQVRTHL